MSGSRRRALVLVLIAATCGVGSAVVAARNQAAAVAGYGETAPVLVLELPLEAGTRLAPKLLGRVAGSTEIPLSFLPPDAVASAREVRGAELAADLPPGSYLLRSHLVPAGGPAGAGAGLAPGEHPVEVEIADAAALSSSLRGEAARVDVIAAAEPGLSGSGRVRVVARGVRLLGIEAAGARGRRSVATLALDRKEALAVIEAENFAREVRLIAR